MGLVIVLLIICWAVCLRNMLVKPDDFNFHLFVGVSIMLLVFSTLGIIGL